MDEEEKRKFQASRSSIINQWIIFVGFICILFGGCIITYFIITDNIHKCTSDPAKYLIEKIAENEFLYRNMSFEKATILLYSPGDDIIAAKSIEVEFKEGKIVQPQASND